MGIEKWIEEKKASGAIRQIGFSYQGNSEMFCNLVDVYDWDFCQIQYNYMDEHSQAGRRGLYHAHKKGIPVICGLCDVYDVTKKFYGGFQLCGLWKM